MDTRVLLNRKFNPNSEEQENDEKEEDDKSRKLFLLDQSNSIIITHGAEWSILDFSHLFEWYPESNSDD